MDNLTLMTVSLLQQRITPYPRPIASLLKPSHCSRSHLLFPNAMSTKVSSPHRILCDSTAINRELTPLRCNSGSPTSLKKTKVVLSTSKVNIIETVNRTTNDSRSTSPSPVTSRTPPATNTSTAKDQLEDRITKLKSEVQHLKLSLRTTPTTEQVQHSTP